MICVLPLFRLGFSECRQISNVAARVAYDNPSSCIVVRNSFFLNLSAELGGALSISGWIGIEVIGSTFLNCTSAEWGGAIRSSCLNSSICECCGTNCFTTTTQSDERYGQFAQLGFNGNFNPTIAWLVLGVSVLACPPLDSTGSKVQRGSINSDRLCVAGKVSNTNFTSNDAEEGSAVMVTNRNSSFSCQFLTIVGVSGKSGIHSKVSSPPSVELCNLYNNSMSPNNEGAVLFTVGTGMHISKCIFSNNLGDIFCSGSRDSDVIVVSNCVFTSANWTSKPSWLSLTNNTFSMFTASLSFSQLDPFFCPASTPQSLPQSPTLTSSPHPSYSVSPWPSRTISRLAVFSASMFPTQSAIAASYGFRPTSDGAISDFLLSSAVEVDSLIFLESGCSEESGGVFWSDIFSESVILPSPLASESAVGSFDDGNLSAGLIAGIICGFLFVIFSILGGYCLIKRFCQTACRGSMKSDSGFDNREIDFVSSTLTETLVPFTDSVMIEGIPADSFTSDGPFILDVPSLSPDTSFHSEI
jgi:hypothetical protein